ncbi:phosphoenolpyruvate-utilizing N-terminal domain-containing protein [Chromobacterium vaccinii]|uniref:phosphoenolpyruvate-utilizing N-terminal domain-containing protein n=1 Tax=Chromobacterium vaccinii TaxID=1108595 RepID=UPI000E208DB4|nr:phosphoenolpyruvate-utilizing N-terminal domain-containing protein [Chromobacterium vaccinii]
MSRAHLAILSDPDFRARLDAAVADGAGPARAVAVVVAHYRAQLSKSASEYLREREMDIRDVGRRLLEALAPEIQRAGRHCRKPRCYGRRIWRPASCWRWIGTRSKGCCWRAAG